MTSVRIAVVGRTDQVATSDYPNTRRLPSVNKGWRSEECRGRWAQCAGHRGTEEQSTMTTARSHGGRWAAVVRSFVVVVTSGDDATAPLEPAAVVGVCADDGGGSRGATAQPCRRRSGGSRKPGAQRLVPDALCGRIDVFRKTAVCVRDRHRLATTLFAPARSATRAGYSLC